mmetsp:Transcript_1154/g.3974  ORF Transcript_1154/g.3974 Transcript_1154/m.3974 type:complete len:475 (-) Transcript_1154:3485-4909(-)
MSHQDSSPDSFSITQAILRTHLHIPTLPSNLSLSASQIFHLCQVIHDMELDVRRKGKMIENARMEKGLIIMQVEKLRKDMEERGVSFDEERLYLHDQIYQLRNDHAEELESLQRSYELTRLKLEQMERNDAENELNKKLSEHYEEKRREYVEELKVERRKNDIYEERIEELERQSEEMQGGMAKLRAICKKLKQVNAGQRRRLEMQRIAMAGAKGLNATKHTTTTTRNGAAQLRKIDSGTPQQNLDNDADNDTDSSISDDISTDDIDDNFSALSSTNAIPSFDMQKISEEDTQIIEELLPIFPQGAEISHNVIHIDFSDDQVQGAIVNVPEDALYLCSSLKEMEKTHHLLDASLRESNLEEFQRNEQVAEEVQATMSDVGAPLFLDTNHLVNNMNSSFMRQGKIASLRARDHMKKLKLAEWKKRRIHALHNEPQFKRNEAESDGILGLKVVVKEGKSPSGSRRVSVATVEQGGR